MPKKITRHIALVRFLTTAPPKQFAALLKILTPDQINALAEISHNTISRDIGLSKTNKRRLRKYTDFLVHLASHHKSISSKKSLLRRSVKALSVLLKVMLPAIETLMASVATR